MLLLHVHLAQALQAPLPEPGRIPFKFRAMSILPRISQDNSRVVRRVPIRWLPNIVAVEVSSTRS